MKRVLILTLLFASTCAAQGVRSDGVVTTRAGNPAAGATIAVCTQPATTTTTPCSPLATLYTDATVATPCAGVLLGPAAPGSPCSNPMVTDGLGNYHFYIKPSSGPVTVQFYGPSLTATAQPDQLINVAISGANTWTALQTFNAGITLGALSTTQSLVPATAGTYNLGTTLTPYNSIVVGSAGGQASSVTSTATSSRGVVLPDSSGTVSFAAAQYCGATSGGTQACTNTVKVLPIIVFGEVTLNTATTQSITSLPFTGTTYSCSGSDLTTATGIVSFNTYGTTSVIIQESGGVNTDHLRYLCVGF